MELIDIAPPATTPVAEKVAIDILSSLNAELIRRVEQHRRSYLKFWDSACTPDELLLALGTRAATVLAIAAESIDHIGRLAALAGKNLLDFAPLEVWQPRRAFIPHPDGTMTLEPPAVGYNAWGRLIPESEWEVDEATGWKINPINGFLAAPLGLYDPAQELYVNEDGRVIEPQPTEADLPPEP